MSLSIEQCGIIGGYERIIFVEFSTVFLFSHFGSNIYRQMEITIVISNNNLRPS